MRAAIGQPRAMCIRCEKKKASLAARRRKKLGERRRSLRKNPFFSFFFLSLFRHSLLRAHRALLTKGAIEEERGFISILRISASARPTEQERGISNREEPSAEQRRRRRVRRRRRRRRRCSRGTMRPLFLPSCLRRSRPRTSIPCRGTTS